MKTKKNHHLFIMLGVLITHTVLLSLWLSDEETVQRKSSIKSGKQNEEINQLPILKTSFIKHKESVNTRQPAVSTKSFNSLLK